MPNSDTDSYPTEAHVRPEAARLGTAPATPNAAFSGLNAPARDGEDIPAAAAAHLEYLEYLTTLAKDLGVIDVVESYFTPIVGRWSDLHAEAGRWRHAAETAGRVSGELGDHLGRLDAAWAGKDADAFVTYIGEVGVASGDVEDALNAMAGALDEVAGAVRQITVEMAELLTDTAELTSQSAMLPVDGEKRARRHLIEAQQSAKALFEAARDVLEAFSRFCDGVDGPDAPSRSLEIPRPYPQERFTLRDDVGSAPGEDSGVTSPSSAHGTPGDASQDGTGASPLEQGKETVASPITDVGEFSAGAMTGAAATAAVAGQNLMGGAMMPMGIGGGQGGDDKDHKVKPRSVTQPAELFGEPATVVPPVIGEDTSSEAASLNDLPPTPK
jgi:uncharacterized protein YukE